MSRIKHSAVLFCLLSGCARALLGPGEPLVPWPSRASTVREDRRGETLVLRPRGTAWGVVLFLHGFATEPGQYRFTLEQLAERGLLVWAPTLPDFFVGRVGYHAAVLAAARQAYEEAALEATGLGLPPPALVGHSLGGGAAAGLAGERGVRAVLWGPVELDVPPPPLQTAALVLVADHDCIAKRGPYALAARLGPLASLVELPGNHVHFTDRSDARFDCPSPVSHDAQRRDVVEHTVAFLRP